MIDKLVQALESEASWVELYGITGELVVPGITLTDDEIGSGLRQVMEVSSYHVLACSAEHKLTNCLDTEPKAFRCVIRRVEGHRHPCGRPTDTCAFLYVFVRMGSEAKETP